MNIRSEWCESLSPLNLFYTKEETIESVKSNFDIRRYHSSEGYSVIVDGVVEQAVIQNHSNPINESDVDKKILLPMESSVRTGSYVNFRNQIWMVNSNIDIVDDAYKMCQMQLCNFILKFQMPFSRPSTAPLYTLDENGIVTLANEQLLVDVHRDIFEYPCVTTNKTQGTGEDKGNIITLPDGRKSVLLPCDDVTVLIRDGKRFFLDLHPTEPTPYRVTYVDTTTYNYGGKGLIQLILEEDQRHSNDRIDLGVCNYSGTEQIQPQGNVKINVDGQLIVGGNMRTFSATFYDDNNNVLQNITPIWDIQLPIGYADDFELNYDKDKVTLKISENYNLLGEEITVTVCDKSNQFQGICTYKIESGW